MNEKIIKKVPRETRIFAERPSISKEELDRRKAKDEEFAQRCREIFWRVYPELIKEHYNWAIMIEPDSGEYFIDPDPEVAFQISSIPINSEVKICNVCLLKM